MSEQPTERDWTEDLRDILRARTREWATAVSTEDAVSLPSEPRLPPDQFREMCADMCDYHGRPDIADLCRYGARNELQEARVQLREHIAQTIIAAMIAKKPVPRSCRISYMPWIGDGQDPSPERRAELEKYCDKATV